MLVLVPIAILALFVAAETSVARLGDGPILKPAPSIGDNLNGPSLIRAPAWIAKPMGRYYLYFAHHNGTFIRLAYADRIAGPWKIHEPGTLRLEQANGCRGHVASPDMHVDSARREIRMYFHCPTGGSQQQETFLAISADGLTFTPKAGPLGPSYFRVFQWRGMYYAIARAGEFFRSPDGVRKFEAGPKLFGGPRILRHAAVEVQGDRLSVFYSRVGEAPERIYHAVVRLTADWMQWADSGEVEVLRPEKDWEGARLAVAPSKSGAAPGPLNELRDPGLFREGGKTYLLYSVAGESGIAVAVAH